MGAARELADFGCEGFEVVLALDMRESFGAVPAAPVDAGCAVVRGGDLVCERLGFWVSVEGGYEGVDGVVPWLFVAGVVVGDCDAAHGGLLLFNLFVKYRRMDAQSNMHDAKEARAFLHGPLCW